MRQNSALRRERELRGWSQAHLARKLGTDARTISRWERGVISPSPHFRTQLCDLFQSEASTLGFLETHDEGSRSLRPGPEAAQRLPLQLLQSPFSPRFLLPHDAFVGRETFLHEVLDCFQRGGVCALYGLPGVGKTTIAQVLVHHAETLRLFPDGVLWISLGPTADTESELLRVAALLQVPESERSGAKGSKALAQVVQCSLGSRRVLLVIDDAWSVEETLAVCIGGPNTTTLVTTRLPEVAFALYGSTPLLVPELDEQQSHLLLERFIPQVGEASQESVAALMQAIGGLPLSLTLIGSYLRSQSVGGQHRRIQAALAHLTDASARLHLAGQPSGSPGPASSLASVIAVSDEHVSEQARQALRALSVLPAKPDRFSEAAALAVTAQGVEVLDELVDAGLLEGAGDGHYRLHQAIADYGTLHRKDALPLRRLVDYALRVCQEHKNERTFLAQEHATLLAALAITVREGWFPERLQLLKGLRGLWFAQYHYALLEKEYTQALAVASSQDHLAGQLLVLHDLGRLANTRGLFYQAEELFAQGLLLVRQHPESVEESLRFLNGYGLTNFMLRKLDVAEQAFREGLALAQSQQRNEEIAVFLNGLGLLVQQQGRFRQAMQFYQQSLEVVRSLHQLRGICLVLQNSGVCAVALGQWDEAEQQYQEAQRIAVAEGFEPYRLRSFLLFGVLAWCRGALAEAETLLQEGWTHVHQVGDTELEGDLLHQLALLAVQWGDLIPAHRFLEQAAPLAAAMETVGSRGRHAYVQGEWLLAQQQAQQAEQEFARALPLLVDEEEWPAMARYGLARAHAAQGNEAEARQWGEQSLAQFSQMEHWRAAEVRTWLTSLPPQQSPVLATAVGEEMVQQCPLCGDGGKIHKKGKTRKGTQRYQCVTCGSSFSQRPPSRQEQDQTKRKRVWELAAMGFSQRAIARELGVHHKTVGMWLASTKRSSIELPQDIPISKDPLSR